MNTINYNLIRTVHRIDAILNNEETHRRLRETAANPYPRDKRCVALAKVLTKKSGMSQTELDTLQSFPDEGINIGHCISHALIFADAFRYMPVAKHKAIVSLLKQGALAIVEGCRVDTATRDRMEQVIVKV